MGNVRYDDLRIDFDELAAPVNASKIFQYPLFCLKPFARVLVSTNQEP